MRSLKVSLSIVILSTVLSANAQDVHVIPFRLTAYNNISVNAVLNGKDTVDLMVHTAANSLTLTEDAVKKLKSISFEGKTDSIKSWGGEANSARVSFNNSIQIGSLHWQNVSITENVNSGQDTDGKFGINLFDGWCIQLDFSQSIIRLSKSLPKSIRRFEKLKLTCQDGDLFIDSEVRTKNGVIKNSFLLHSGYAGALLLDDAFAQNTNLSSVLEVISEQSLTDSYGNIVKVKKVLMPELAIGNTKLTNVPAGFFDGAIGAQKISILGGDVLKRFDWTIDAKREFVYVRPSKWMTSEYRK
jgi:hypothetical protein